MGGHSIILVLALEITANAALASVPSSESVEINIDSRSGVSGRCRMYRATARVLKRAKRVDNDDGEYQGGTSIDMDQAVTLTISSKYLANFSKSTSLSRQVQLVMSTDVPLLVSQRASSIFTHIHSRTGRIRVYLHRTKYRRRLSRRLG